MTVIKRLHDCLLPTRDAVIDFIESEKANRFKEADENYFFAITEITGYPFYNTSKFTFESLLSDPANIEENFKDYISGFSQNIIEIINLFDFYHTIDHIIKHKALYYIIKEFNSKKGYLGPDKINTTDCGNIFENLIYRFQASTGTQGGDFFTSSDVVELMSRLAIIDANIKNDDVLSVYDMTAGTGQMLNVTEDAIHKFFPDVKVLLYGQEVNPKTCAIAKADMLIKNKDCKKISNGNTLTEDYFPNHKFDIIMSNPPFGVDWRTEKPFVLEEEKKGFNGRFGPGHPPVSDGQMLFTLNGISKLSENGHMYIIQSCSPLFKDDDGSNNIRKYIIENDLLNAVIALPKNLFYNTPIQPTIWCVCKNKASHRKGKIQIINASECFEKHKKSVGKKQVGLNEACLNIITKAYESFESKEYIDGNLYIESKVFNNEDFGYTKVTVETPVCDENGKPILKKGKRQPVKSKSDIEIIPLTEDVDEYIKKNVFPYNPLAYLDRSKDRISYEIPLTKCFYKYQKPEATDDILSKIINLENEISVSLQNLFNKEG